MPQGSNKLQFVSKDGLMTIMSKLNISNECSVWVLNSYYNLDPKALLQWAGGRSDTLHTVCNISHDIYDPKLQVTQKKPRCADRGVYLSSSLPAAAGGPKDTWWRKNTNVSLRRTNTRKETKDHMRLMSWCCLTLSSKSSEIWRHIYLSLSSNYKSGFVCV